MIVDTDWRFILRYDCRSQHDFENNNAIIPSEEDNQNDGNRERYNVHILFQLLYCGCIILFFIFMT